MNRNESFKLTSTEIWTEYDDFTCEQNDMIVLLMFLTTSPNHQQQLHK